MLVGATDEALCLLEFVDRLALETQIDRNRRRLGAVLVPGETDLTRQAADELGRSATTGSPSSSRATVSSAPMES